MAVIGKEDGVDQLGLAARILGDKSHIEFVIAQTIKQMLDAQVDLGIVQLLFVQPAAVIAESVDKSTAPLTIGGKLVGESAMRHDMHPNFERLLPTLARNSKKSTESA